MIRAPIFVMVNDHTVVYNAYYSKKTNIIYPYLLKVWVLFPVEYKGL